MNDVRGLHLSVVILAGGESARMGTDKGLMLFRGVPLVEYILAQLDGLGNETLIIANRPESYRRFGLPMHTDVFPGAGALGGLYSAIEHAAMEHCLVLACDMPFINRPLIEHLIAYAPDYDVVIPKVDPQEQVEPFRAVYSKACLEPIRAALQRGQRRLISFFGDVRVRLVGRSEVERFDPQLRTFVNVNTPEELARAEALLDAG